MAASFHFFQLETQWGSFVFQWDHDAYLNAVRFLPATKKIQQDLFFQANQPSFISNTARLPHYLVLLIEKFRRYLDSGEPMGNIPWDCISMEGCTPFQREVYQAIQGIPLGETRSYQWVAQRIKKAGANRAVGQALRKNPFLILVPCHRVVHHQEQREGFMGKTDPNCAEVRLKRHLLRIEHDFLNPRLFFFHNKPSMAPVLFS